MNLRQQHKMDIEIQKILKEAMNRAPVMVRDAILHTDISGKIQKIANDNGLRIDDAGKLETEVMLALLGLEDLKDFHSTIKRELNLGDSVVNKITKEVDEAIFDGVRAEMMKSSVETTPSKEPNSGEVEDEKIDREELLREIERLDAGDDGSEGRVVSPPRLEGLVEAGSGEDKTELENIQTLERKSIIEEKLGGTVHTQKEEVDMNATGGKNRPDPGRHIDPYREPIE